MRDSLLAIAVLVIAVLVIASRGFCLGQQAIPDLTAGEVVTRNEATWAKLSRYSLRLDTKGHMQIGSGVIGKDDVKKVQAHDFTTSALVYRDGDRYCCSFPVGDALNVTKEIHDKDLFVFLGKRNVQISDLAKAPPPPAKYMFGGEIAKFLMAPTTSLRKWVDDAKPSIERDKNDEGEVIYVLQGKFTTTIDRPGQRVLETDEIAVTINAERGFLIEQIDFVCAKQESLLAPKVHQWHVQGWREVGKGLHFPESIRSETRYWNFDDTSWFEWSVSDFEIAPSHLEKQFEYVIAEDAVVRDETGRPGTVPLSIWGKDGKPKKILSENELRVIGIEEQRVMKCRVMEARLRELFPGLRVKASYDATSKDFHSQVHDAEGVLVQEFKTEQALDDWETNQELQNADGVLDR